MVIRNNINKVDGLMKAAKAMSQSLQAQVYRIEKGYDTSAKRKKKIFIKV